MEDNLMQWSAKNSQRWVDIIDALSDSTGIKEFEIVLKALYEDSLYDVAYLLIQALDVTSEGEQIKNKIIMDAFQELWGKDAVKEYIKRFIAAMDK